MGLALKALFKKTEEAYYLQKAKEAVESRRLVNFFHEVSKDCARFTIRSTNAPNTAQGPKRTSMLTMSP